MKAGMERAKDEQDAGKVRRNAKGKKLKPIGRPRLAQDIEMVIKERLALEIGMLKIAWEMGVGSGTVQRIKREIARNLTFTRADDLSATIIDDQGQISSTTTRVCSSGS